MTASSSTPRLDYLDATRAFALLLGVVFHASLSFLPVFIGWAVQDISTSPVVGWFITGSHSFRMATFFLLAGFFGRMTYQRRGIWDFLRTRAVRLGVPFVAGWFLLKPLIVSGWIMGAASLRGDYDFWSAVSEGFASLQTLPAGLFLQTHLWFLYYLLLITALTLFLRQIVGRWAEQADGGVRWLARSRWAPPLLVGATAVVLSRMSVWGVDTPDTSLWPHGPVLMIYGGFFGLGWLLNRQPALLVDLGRLSVGRWLAAVAGVVSLILLSSFQLDPGHLHYAKAHYAFLMGYAVTMWSLVGLTLGVFRKLCERPRAWVRYVADSSYWMYLIHLPIVVWLQVAMAEWPLHWSFKLAAISAITVAVALLTYDLVVRSTWIGVILNGRRRDRRFGLWLRGAFRRTRVTSVAPESAVAGQPSSTSLNSAAKSRSP